MGSDGDRKLTFEPGFKKINISIIGCGYVGTVTGACFAKLGNNVIIVDVDKERIKKINQGASPIYEKDLDELLANNKDKIRATTNYGFAIKNSDVTFVCVGTPSKSDGSIDLSFVETAVTEIGKCLKNKDNRHLVVVKSTVLPGTTRDVVLPLLEKHSGKGAYVDFGLAINPEFLREGMAVEDFLKPDRIVIGTNDEKSKHVLKILYKGFSCPVVVTSLSTAEMIKYASNCFLATKISFANEIGNMCKKLGINTFDVFKGVGLDHRVNPEFFRAGVGFGGSCLPKDVRALIFQAKKLDQTPKMLQAVIDVNEKQPEKMIELLKKHMPLEGKKIGVLGLAFKPDTDDIRESGAITVVDMLIKNGAKVVAFDPEAMDNFKEMFSQIEYVDSAEEVLAADAVLTVAEWKEFKDLDFTNKIVIDGRGIDKAKKEAAMYEGVCW